MTWLPEVDALYTTAHELLLIVPPTATREQDAGENNPVLDVEKVTVPVGLTVVPELVSVTVTVQVEPCETLTGVVQLTPVDVERPIVTLVVPLLPAKTVPSV